MDFTDHALEKGAFLTWQEVSRANYEIGAFWFSPDTTQYFDAKYGRMFGGCWLVHSTQFHGSTTDGPRRFHIAHCLANGVVDSLPGGDTVTLEFVDEDDATRFAESLESGRVSVDRVSYDDHLTCAACNSYATWLVNGDVLCPLHAGVELESYR